MWGLYSSTRLRWDSLQPVRARSSKSGIETSRGARISSIANCAPGAPSRAKGVTPRHLCFLVGLSLY